MIALISNEAEVEKYIEIVREEATKMMDRNGGVLNLGDHGVYSHLMDRVKTRFRAWQMEQDGFDGSEADRAYKRDSLRASVFKDLYGGE